MDTATASRDLRMSDLHVLREKTAKGKDWRGTIRVMLEDQEIELTVRQLTDPEMFEIMSMVDMQELKSLRGDLPEDELERFYDLQDKDELTEDEEEEFSELEEQLNEKSANLFEELSRETFKGIVKCAEYCVEPDAEDLKHYFMDDGWVAQKEKEYGEIKTPEDCYEPLKDDLGEDINAMTNFTSFNIGIMALMESVGDSKN